MELHSSTVHRNLDAKLKVVGLEVHDLLFVLIFAAVMNLLFGNTSLAVYLVFLLPTIMAGVLYVGKRGKPDGYLIHFLRYYLTKGHYPAGQEAVCDEQMRGRICY